MSLGKLQPVSIEYLANYFARVHEFVFCVDHDSYYQNSDFVPGIFIDMLEKIKNDFWMIIHHAGNNELAESFLKNRIPTIEYLQNRYGRGSYRVELVELGNKTRQKFLITV